MRSRPTTLKVLGCLWLLDGLLQLQPHMFTRGFFADTIGMANMGLPHPVEVLDVHLTTLLGSHPAPFNALFACLQLALGAGILWRRTTRIALAASIPWALAVWVVGEGFGGLFMPGTSMLNGAPGPALLYALAAVLLWPATAGFEPAGSEPAGSEPATAGGATGRAPARPDRRATLTVWVWVAVWAGTALLEMEWANHDAAVPGAEMTGAASYLPGPLGLAARVPAALVGHRGPAFAALAGLAQAAVAAFAVPVATRRRAVAAGIALSGFYWVAGQALGAPFSGRATDPGTAPLVILLGLALWPARRQPAVGPVEPPAPPRRPRRVLPAPVSVGRHRPVATLAMVVATGGLALAACGGSSPSSSAHSTTSTSAVSGSTTSGPSSTSSTAATAGGSTSSTSATAGSGSTTAPGGGTSTTSRPAATSTTVKATTTTARPTTTTAPGPTTTSAAATTAVTATETEYHIALSRSSFAPGRYRFDAVNSGSATHNLVINGPGVSSSTDFLSPGQRQSLTVTLQPGSYDIYCGVDGHRQLGMEVHITVG
ncbi:MAG TPA: hypothetical protein VFH45_01775 [Acidimicrobiales bacterium]|nr:hypothetical protein [Acidimicrobiales bacterium]